jgi:hypothetical protein
MSKRLQVIVDDAELTRFRRAAGRAGLTLSEWARQALRRGERDGATRTYEEKMEAVRRAVEWGERDGAPAPPIEQMLEEIERGYLEGP